MESNERQLIDGLFNRLQQAEQQAAPRDAEAERHIAAAVAAQPAAPYYMSQVILAQEQALQALNQRVQQLEREVAERPAAGGGFLGGLFGAPAAPTPPARAAAGSGRRGWSGTPAAGAAAAPGTDASAGGRRGWSNAAPGAGSGAGGGFLASAAQTALGVAGGVMLANALTGLFSGHQAEAAGLDEAAADPFAAASEDDLMSADPGLDDAGFDDAGFDDGGGDFDVFGGF